MEGFRRKVQWEELPEEILSEIGKRLKYDIELLRFKSVCRSWRSSLSSYTKTKFTPLEVPEPPILNPCHRSNGPTSFFLTERTLYAFRDNDGKHLLVELDELLPQKFTDGRCVFTLSLNYFDECENLVDKPVFPISKYYHIILVHHIPGGEKKIRFFDKFVLHMGAYDVVGKTVPVFDDTNRDLIVGALLNGGRLGLLRILRRSHTTCDPQEWKVISCDESNNLRGIKFDDVINFDGKLCAVDSIGRVFMVNTITMELNLIAKEAPQIRNVEGLQFLERRWRSRLVMEASGNKLYMLVPFRHMVDKQVKPEIRVYELQKQAKEWVEVENIGEQVVFVGHDYSFATYARDLFIEYEGYTNHIIVIYDSFPLYENTYLNRSQGGLLFKEIGASIGIYDVPHGANFRLLPWQRWYSFNGEGVF